MRVTLPGMGRAGFHCLPIINPGSTYPVNKMG